MSCLKGRNLVYCLQHNTNSWQDSLYCRECLLSGLEVTKPCSVSATNFWHELAQDGVYYLDITQLLTKLFVQLEYPYIMFRKNKILCITLTNTAGSDRDICTIGLLFVSHLEGTKYYALLSVIHQLLTGVFTPLELPFFMFRNHKKLCLKMCSFWQRYLYHWSILILCIENKICCVLPWETY